MDRIFNSSKLKIQNNIKICHNMSKITFLINDTVFKNFVEHVESSPKKN